jgi:WD40 repeat protein
MNRQKRQSVFISYARRDGKALALRLKKDLTAAKFDVWLDTERIGGGASWTRAIEEAIDRAKVVLALLTPGSYASEICRAEQLRSLRKDKCVIPLLAAKTDIPLYFESSNYRDFTRIRGYAASLQALLGDIKGLKGNALRENYRSTPATYIAAPPEVANYIDRPGAIGALRDALFAEDEHRPAIALTALEGMGGIGKTVLAQALFRDEVVQQAFPDGLVWITVGREPSYDVTAKLREITAVLGGATNDAISVETQYRNTMADKAALLVIDDIWNTEHLETFLANSPRSRFLFTTRNSSIARFSGAREYRVDLLDAAQARELLALWARVTVRELPPAADEIIHECGGLPLALATVGPLLRGATPADWADTAELLRSGDLSAIEEQLESGHRSFFRAIDASVKSLEPQMQERYGRLAVLLDDMKAPLPVLETLWNSNDVEARRFGRFLEDRSLLQRDAEGGIQLHDLQLDYVRARYGNSQALALIHGAVRLSSHVIEKDPRQFSSQVVGRLLPYAETPAIRRFVDELAAGAPRPRLQPLVSALHPPGTPLLYTLEGHSAAAAAVAITADGKRAVSASWDKTVKVWDLDTGRELRSLEGHADGVEGVAITGEGRLVVSASSDGTLKVWDPDTGRVVRTLKGHSGAVRGVGVTADGRRAVSASNDRTLKVWDLKTGRVLHSLEGHADGVEDVAITPDGKRAVSASRDKTVMVWNPETGRALRTLTGHTDMVRRVAITRDGQRAVSASQDRTLRVWDLETGRTLQILRGHTGSVLGVALPMDASRAISASVDNTLKVWDLGSGLLVRTLEGNSTSVFNVAVTADGRRVVSASLDYTLKVWDLENGRELNVPRAHSEPVWCLAATPDGNRAVSGSLDKTLKLWDLVSGIEIRATTLDDYPREVAITPDGKRLVFGSWDGTLKVSKLDTGGMLRSFKGHTGAVEGVAITADGKRAVSASRDKTLKVWDLKSGRVLRTLEGHTGDVWSVAITPDGRRAVSGSLDRTAKVWNLESGRVLHTLEGHSESVSSVGITGDGKRAVSGSDDARLKIWDLETGRVLHTLEGHSERIWTVSVFGVLAVSASEDKTLTVWNLDTGSAVVTLTGDAPFRCCAFAGLQRIIAGDGHGRLHILRFET